MTQKTSKPNIRTGVSELDYSKFANQGANLASTDLMDLSVRNENPERLNAGNPTTMNPFAGPNAPKWGAEAGFMAMSQDTLDKMMSMFSMRKKEVDTKRAMPGLSQTMASNQLNIG